VIEWIDQLKVALEAVRVALGVVRDVRDTLPSDKSTAAIDQAIQKAERATALAEAEIAKGLGYHLCKCTFPPQIMLFTRISGQSRVYNCPSCGTAALEDL
jgi:hypothetical protein